MGRRFVVAAAILTAVTVGCTDEGVPPKAEPPRSPGPTSDAPGVLRLALVTTAKQPIHLVAAPDDPRLFVVEKGGRVLVVDGGVTIAHPFLDITDEVSAGGEQGLLSMAFAPDYAKSGRAYVNYTDRDGDTRIVEFRASASDRNRLDPATRRELISIEQPYANHNGGLVMFDPSGMLVIGMGDGGSGNDPQNRAQNLDSLLGKLLRIDPSKQSSGRQYAIPADNPFRDRAGVRPEIYAYGLRNPWRFSYDTDGTLFLADVGQGEFEEVDVVAPTEQAGANYGWRKFEAKAERTDDSIDENKLVVPAVVIDHDNGRCAVIGGVVYRGSVSELEGSYLYGDNCSGEVFAHRADGEHLLSISVPQLTSFGVDANGEVYVVSQGGAVSRITVG